MRGLFSSTLFFSSLQIVVPASKCYYPNGAVATNNSPCDEDADDSPCCWAILGAVCMSNKLCRNPSGKIARGTCTNENWDSPDCPNYCLNDVTAGWDLVSCSNVTDTSTSYCCKETENCCDSGVGRFDVLPAEPQEWATWNKQSSRFVVILQTTSSASPTSTSDTTATTSTTPSPTTTQSESRGSENQGSESQGGTAGSGVSSAAKAGIGAGVGVGVALVAVIVFLLLKIRKHKKALQDQRPETEQLRRSSEGRVPLQPTEIETRPASTGVKYELDARGEVQGQWERVELPTPATPAKTNYR